MVFPSIDSRSQKDVGASPRTGCFHASYTLLYLHTKFSGARPLTGPYSFIFTSFLPKSTRVRGPRPLLTGPSPPTENPGSAPVTPEMSITRCIRIELILGLRLNYEYQYLHFCDHKNVLL